MWLFFGGRLCRWNGSCSGRPGSECSEPKLGTPLLMQKRLNLCRSKVRSRLKRDANLNKVLAVCLTLPAKCSDFDASLTCCVVLVRFFFAERGSPTALVQPSASPMWQAPACQDCLHSRRYTEVHVDLCQFGDKLRRPTRILLANADPCNVEKLHRMCHGANLTCSYSGSAHLQTTDPVPCSFPAEFCHSLVQALMAEPHARFSLNQPILLTPPNI